MSTSFDVESSAGPATTPARAGRYGRRLLTEPDAAGQPAQAGLWRRPPLWLVVASAVYLTAPLVLFVLTWLRPVTYPALVLLVLAAGAGVRLNARGSGRAHLSSTAVAAVAGCGATALTGIFGYPFTMKGDWNKHAAIVNSLAETSWPTILEDGDVLRYYTGFYLVPAWVARATGSDPRLVLAAWFALGMSLGLALLLNGTRLRLAVPGVVLLFLMSGWDSIACLLTEAPMCSPVHQEIWSGSIPVNAFATVTLWRPHQLIPVLLLVPLVMGLRGDRRMPWLVLPLLVSCLFWGPFVAVGLAMLVLPALAPVLRARDWSRLVADWVAPTLMAVPAAGVIAAYLVTGAANVPFSFLWSTTDLVVVPWTMTWAAVVVLDVLPLVVIPVLVRGGLTGVHRVVVLTTCALLLTKYGAFNDLVINATLPFVVLFGWETAYFAARMTERGTAPLRGFGAVAATRQRTLALRAATAVVVFFGAQTAVVEMTESVAAGTSEGSGTAVGPAAYWEFCQLGGECIPPQFRYQYQTSPEDFPPWLLRGDAGGQ